MVTLRLQSSSRVDLVVALVLLTMCMANAQTNRAKAYAPPVGGAWFGSVPGTSDLDQYDASLTAKPASYVFSVDLPLSRTVSAGVCSTAKASTVLMCVKCQKDTLLWQ